MRPAARRRIRDDRGPTSRRCRRPPGITLEQTAGPLSLAAAAHRDRSVAIGITSWAMIEWSCEAVVFDLDGVLVDSAACVERHWRRWAAEHGLDGGEIMRFAHGRPTAETIRLVAPHLPSDGEAARLDASEAFDTEGVVAIRGAAELVRLLPPNAWAIVALTRLRHTGLPLPAVLITADDVKRGKPNPEGYMLAARRLSMAPDRCVVVEDAPAGVDAARAAGMRVVGLTTTHSRAELKGADVTAAQLVDIQVSASDTRPAGGLTVCITEAS